MKKLFAAVSTAVLLSGCVAVTSANLSNVVEKGGEQVKAESSGIGILSLTVPDQQALEGAALKTLKTKGATKNITTRLQVRNWVLVQFYTVSASGEK